MKWLCRYSSELNPLWRIIIGEKYSQTDQWCTSPVNTPHVTGIWKAIRQLWDSFQMIHKGGQWEDFILT
uniref:Putative ovule protein n=1 Tax=Solanum chacoense TaxID=4108 RepID=A0A0V0HCX2_SOLCH